MYIFLGRAAGFGDGVDIAIAFDGKTSHQFTGFADAVDDHPGPFGFDADDHHRRHIGVRTGANQGAKMQFEVLAELQPAVGMGNRQGAPDIVGNRLASGVGKIVQRQDNHVIAYPDAAVFALETKNIRRVHARSQVTTFLF